MERAVNRALATHRTHVDHALRLATMTAAAIPPDAFNLNEWDTDIAEEVEPTIAAILGEMSDATFSLLALTPAQRAQVLGNLDLETIASTFVERIKNLGPLTADRLHAALAKGIGKGEGIDKLAVRVDEVFTRAASSAETIARTETHGAAELTSYTTAGEIHRNGMPLTKTWLATADERTRETHDEADGQTVGYDEPFDVGGEELAFPGDPDGSAEETINCRCTATFEEADGGETEVEAEE